MAERVFRSLRAMADDGKIVIASLHCPSSLMYHSSTNAILLTSDGRLAYHGKASEAAKHFVGTLG